MYNYLYIKSRCDNRCIRASACLRASECVHMCTCVCVQVCVCACVCVCMCVSVCMYVCEWRPKKRRKNSFFISLFPIFMIFITSRSTRTEYNVLTNANSSVGCIMYNRLKSSDYVIVKQNKLHFIESRIYMMT